MKATEQYFHVVLFIMLCKVVLRTFMSVDETLVCDHSNESYMNWAELFGMVLYSGGEKVNLNLSTVDTNNETHSAFWTEQK